MTNLSSSQAIGLSFEFFPPNTTEGSLRLWRSVERLAPLGPDFVSVTYGAGGTTRERTMAAIQTIIDRAHMNVAGHLTCVGASKAETLKVAEEYARLGVRKIVALRGDPPKGEGRFRPHPEGFSSAAELTEALAALGKFDITVSAYPEKHPEAQSFKSDIENLKRKADAGANQAITQFFFDNDDFYRFRDEVAKAGVTIPVIPGIIPIENFNSLQRFAGQCGAKIPQEIADAFANATTEDDAHLLATAICSEQCDELIENGVEHLHFYTLNKPDLTFNVCQALGIAPLPSFSSVEGAA